MVKKIYTTYRKQNRKKMIIDRKKLLTQGQKFDDDTLWTDGTGWVDKETQNG